MLQSYPRATASRKGSRAAGASSGDSRNPIEALVHFTMVTEDL